MRHWSNLPKPTNFSPELRERAVRMVYEVRESYDSQWAAIEAVSRKIGCTAQTLSNWIRKASSSSAPSTPTDPRIRELEREVRELKRANEILNVASAFFAQAELRPPFEVMWRLVDTYREQFGVEPMCRTLHIAPSAYRRHAARLRDLTQRSARGIRDEVLAVQIRRVWQENYEVYGVRKVWRSNVSRASGRGALHGGAVDAWHGAAWCHTRQGGEDHAIRPCQPQSRRSGETAVYR